MYTIYDLDVASATVNDLAFFIRVCQNKGVAFRIDSVNGPNGYPTCELSCADKGTLRKVLIWYCGGDEAQADDIMGDVALTER